MHYLDALQELSNTNPYLAKTEFETALKSLPKRAKAQPKEESTLFSKSYQIQIRERSEKALCVNVDSFHCL